MNIKALLSLVFILLITSFITLELILNNITIASQINVVPLNKAPVPNDDVLLLKTHYSDDDIDRRIVKAAEFIHPKLRSTAYIYNLKTKELKKTKFHRDKWSFIPNISPVDIPACKRMVFFERSNYSWGPHSPFPSSSLVARDYTGKAIISRKLKEPDFMPLNDGRQILINDANNHKYIWDVCSNKIRKTRVMDDYSFRLNTTNPFSTSSSNDEYYFSYIYFDSDDNPNWIGFYEYDVSQDSLKTLPVSGGESHGRLYTSGEITPSFAGDKALICKCIKTSNKEDTDESQKCDVFIYSLKSNIILKKLDRYKQCYDIDFTFMPKGDLLFSTKINSHITLMDWNGSVKKTIPIKNARRFMINGHPQWLSDDTVLLAGVSSPLEDKVIVDLTTGKSEWVSDIVARHEKKK